MNRNLRLILVVVAVLLLWLVSSALFTVNEGEQALIIRQGAPIASITTPGLNIKLPLVDSVIFYDARLLTLESPAEQVILGDQKRIVVQAYTRFHIVDPLRFNQAVRTVELAGPQLRQLVGSSLRRELGQVNLPALLSNQRSSIVERVHAEVADKAHGLGVEGTEVRLHRADLPLETSQAIYDRMKSERQREAKELRAQGFEWAQGIQAKADRERTVLISQAQRQSRVTRGEADAAANGILTEAFGHDPAFYKLYRSLQTYRQALADSGATVVVSPDAAFLRDFKTGPEAASRR